MSSPAMPPGRLRPAAGVGSPYVWDAEFAAFVVIPAPGQGAGEGWEMRNKLVGCWALVSHAVQIRQAKSVRA
jgi:hypothetical protein